MIFSMSGRCRRRDLEPKAKSDLNTRCNGVLTDRGLCLLLRPKESVPPCSLRRLSFGNSWVCFMSKLSARLRAQGRCPSDAGKEIEDPHNGPAGLKPNGYCSKQFRISGRTCQKSPCASKTTCEAMNLKTSSLVGAVST